MGRGYGPVDKITRRLEDGDLPILHGTLVDDDIRYELTAFVTLEKSPLTAENVRGTHYLVGEAYGYTDDVIHPGPAGMRPWPEEFKQMFPALLQEDMNQPEETVLMLRVAMVNTAMVPRYAWFRNPAPTSTPNRKYESSTGFGVSGNGLVHSISTLDGKPLPNEEVGFLLKPGAVATIEVRLPHRPIPRERAAALAKIHFADLHQECRAFWQKKLDRGAQIHLPDSRLEEMVKAGLWHLDLVAYGREPSGPIAASTGVYTPIGSESAPIIQFFDSMGWHDVARRALMFFVEKQHEDGHMQNYGDYEIETAGAVHSLGEHYRYTQDDAWVKQIEPNLLKACEWILKERRANQREELRGRAYGMMVGKVADPQDRLHNFMFNGYHYVAVQRAAEMLAKVDPSESQRLAREAEAFRQDIRTAYFEVLGKSPVMPLGDGTWCPTAPPWTEYRGALALYADGGQWYTHGAMNVRESAGGPQWLVATEVLEPNELATTFLLDFHNELLTQDSVAFSQPYYSQDPVIHLQRGETKGFLKPYFYTLAAMADRQTYDFFEHFMGGPQKTHEEGEFLMQTRRILYLEQGDRLQLLVGIPRKWLEDGKQITLDRVASYFGPVSLRVDSKLSENRIEAIVECDSARAPKTVALRLPHPEGRKATWVKGGIYDPQTERVTIEPFSGRAQVVLGFGESN